jgi:hypothetical protein
MRSDMRELGRSDHHRFKAVRTFKRGDQNSTLRRSVGPKPSWSNSPIAEQVQSICHDTLPWLISFSLDGKRSAKLQRSQRQQAVVRQLFTHHADSVPHLVLSLSVAALVAIVFTFAWARCSCQTAILFWNLDMRRPAPLSNPFIATMTYSVTFLCLFPFRLFYSAYGCGEGNPSNQSMKTTAPLLRIALEMILIAGWQMIWLQ